MKARQDDYWNKIANYNRKLFEMEQEEAIQKKKANERVSINKSMHQHSRIDLLAQSQTDIKLKKELAAKHNNAGGDSHHSHGQPATKKHTHVDKWTINPLSLHYKMWEFWIMIVCLVTTL